MSAATKRAPRWGIKPRTEGVWTPYGAVLCVPCHNVRTGRRDEAHTAGELRAWGYDRGGTCDECDARLFLPDHVAPLAFLVDHVEGGMLVQTGGMCSALEVEGPEGSDLVLVATAFDGIELGIYTKAAWRGDDEPSPLRYTELKEDDERSMGALGLRAALRYIRAFRSRGIA